MAGTFVWVGGFTQWWGTSGADTNWAISGTPVGTIPGAGDIVEIKVGVTVDIGVAGTTSYEGNTSADDSITSDGQTIYNSGVIRLDASQTNTGYCTWTFAGTTGIGYDPSGVGTGSAAGSILMTDNAKNAIDIGAVGSGYAATLIDVDNDISGAGTIAGFYGSTLIVGVDSLGKQTAVNADGTHALTISNLTIDNDGVLESTTAAGLSLVGVTVDQTRSTTYNNSPRGLTSTSSLGTPLGVVEAAGANAHVELVGANIVSGALETSLGGVIDAQSATLDGSHNDGAGNAAPVTIDGAVAVSGNLNLVGTINFVSGSTINVIGSASQQALLEIGALGRGGSATLTGSGVINLAEGAGQNARLSDGNGGYDVSLDNRITIRGAGYFGENNQANFDLTNEGSILADGASQLTIHVRNLLNQQGATLEADATGGLTIQAGAFTNYGTLSALFGNISASASTFANISGSTLTGGEWDALAGHTLTVDDAVAITTLAAGVTLAAGSKITFDGVDLSQSLTTVASGGALGLFGATFTDANVVTIASGGTLTGFGEVNAALIDNGLIQGTGALKFDQALSGTGAVNFLQSNALEFAGPVSVASVNFDTNANRTALDTLTIDDPAHFTSVIASFGAGNDAIVLKGLAVASVSLSGPNTAGISTLTAKNASGATLATLSLSGDFAGLTPIVASDGSIRLTTQHAEDFTGSGYSDVAFENTTGTFATWVQNGAGLTGGATLGAPGPAWSVAASGDENGDGVADLFLSNATTGQIAVWSMAADAIANTYVFAGPGGSWKVVGRGDFNGDGRADLLFRNDNGDLATWDMNGAEIIGGGLIGNPGAGWAFVGTGDFNGDGKTDLLFENASGTYATWTLDDTAISGGATLGSPGAGWIYKGTGDFNGDGTSDILFENVNTGVYATWDMRDDAVSGGGAIGSPGAAWVLRGIGNYDASARSGLLFQNTATGQYADWTRDDTAVTGGAALGSPGAAWSVQGAAPAAKPELPGTIFFQNAAGTIASWNVEGGLNAGGAVFGAAAGYTMLGVGDFNGDLEPDVLFADNAGNYAIWTTDGAHVTGGGALGNPGAGWSYVALGDFNGDGNSDILFRDAGGNYAIWDLDGAKQVGGGVLGNPGAGWSFAGVGDFNGDGASDILFANGGTFAIWDIAQNQIVGGATLGGPGGTWNLKGTADFNGDGRTDLLFEDASGNYATWDVGGDALIGGGALGNPGAQFQYAGAADILDDHQASILFYNASSNSYATWNLNDSTVAGGASLGSPGAGWTKKAFV